MTKFKEVLEKAESFQKLAEDPKREFLKRLGQASLSDLESHQKDSTDAGFLSKVDIIIDTIRHINQNIVNFIYNKDTDENLSNTYFKEIQPQIASTITSLSVSKNGVRGDLDKAYQNLNSLIRSLKSSSLLDRVGSLVNKIKINIPKEFLGRAPGSGGSGTVSNLPSPKLDNTSRTKDPFEQSQDSSNRKINAPGKAAPGSGAASELPSPDVDNKNQRELERHKRIGYK